MRHWALALVGLMWLGGCTDLEGTGGVKPTEQEAPIAAPAGVALSTLGIVNVDISKVTFQVSDVESVTWSGLLAHWVPVGTVLPPSATNSIYFKPAPDGNSRHFTQTLDAASATYVYYESFSYEASAVSVSRPGLPARGVTLVPVSVTRPSGSLGLGVEVTADFPADSSGDVTFAAAPGYTLGLRPYGTGITGGVGGNLGGSIGYQVHAAVSPLADTTPTPTPSSPPVYETVQNEVRSSFWATRRATASVDVVVKELDGTPVLGLVAEHFEVGGTSLTSLEGTLSALGDGRYRLQVPTTKSEDQREVSFVITVVNKPGVATGRLYRTAR